MFTAEYMLIAGTSLRDLNLRPKKVLLLLLLVLSLFCRVFTVVYLKQTMFLGYIVLQLFSIYNLCYIQRYFARQICLVLLRYYYYYYYYYYYFIKVPTFRRNLLL